MIRVGGCDGKSTREGVPPAEISRLLAGDGAGARRNSKGPKRILWVDVNEPTDESTFGRGDEEIRGVADEDDEFEDSEDLDEEEEDEEV